MVRKLTLGFKKDYCQHCKHAERKAMRQGRPYCSESYSYRNGHCQNFEPIKPKKGEAK